MADKKTTVKKAAPKKADMSLEEQLVSKQTDLLDARKSHAAGELINPRVLGATRKEIARVKTAIRAESLAKKESK